MADFDSSNKIRGTFQPVAGRSYLPMEQLAASLGTKKQTISRYEKNQREPEYATLIKIAHFFREGIYFGNKL